MNIQLDHLLQAVKSPEDARLAFERQLGVHTTTGGSHPQWGTYNTLCYFGLSYIEWVGVRDEEVAVRTDFGRNVIERLAVHEGPIQFALRTENMDEIVNRWAQQGVPFDGPINASRSRPDGTILHWRMLFPRQQGGTSFKLPFFIEWGSGDGDRAEDLRRTGALPTKPLFRMAAIHSVVEDLDLVKERWDMYYPVALDVASDSECGEGLQATVGDVDLYFWRPFSANMRQIVSDVGETPYQLDLARVESIGHPSDMASLSIHGLVIRIV
ncbi:VOC family protein [Alicyclobacillus dauci]|uniref:VOC family protein n=1 Tax=Alicyclobacillus dauci TaxID=1475485 RepID=A0ABY6Z7A3_9BACL|nr:VOC family protein [Alicyclobacillus dauci]WAH38783.1 VOC family protein [Alicyclobacillus dauci]